MQPGHLELPELRRVTPDGYGALVPLSEATDEERAAYRVALLQFRAHTLATINVAINDANAHELRVINARETAPPIAVQVASPFGSTP